MNDSKYGRIYPERAVAPLRRAVQEHLEAYRKGRNFMAVAHWEALLNTLDSEGFPPEEPLFVLRGQDVLASCTVRHYAEDVRLSGIKEPMRSVLRKHILEFADRMEAWQPRKLPD